MGRVPKWAADHRKDVRDFGCVLSDRDDRWHVVTYLGKGWFKSGKMRWRHGSSFGAAQDWCDRVNKERVAWRAKRVARGFT